MFLSLLEEAKSKPLVFAAIFYYLAVVVGYNLNRRRVVKGYCSPENRVTLIYTNARRVRYNQGKNQTKA